MIHLYEPAHFDSANSLIIMSFTNNTFHSFHQGLYVFYFCSSNLLIILHLISASMLRFLFLFFKFAHYLVLEELGNSHEVHEGDTKDESDKPTHLKSDNNNTNDNYHIEPSHLTMMIIILRMIILRMKISLSPPT